MAMAQLYTDYILAQSKRNPCLQNLCRFVKDDTARANCKVACLEFSNSEKQPYRKDLTLLELELLVNTDVDHCHGRLIIIEDLNRPIIEVLGSALDIDPFFFAAHLHGPSVEIQSGKPSAVMLPSRIHAQNFLSLQYQRSIDFGTNLKAPRKLSRDSNVPRKVVVLPPVKNIYIGLEQNSCSVLLTRTRSKAWLGNRPHTFGDNTDPKQGLILVDSPNSDRYTSPEKQIILPSQPFQGGYEDFSRRSSFLEPDSGYPGRVSLLEDLVYYWEKDTPPSFDQTQPSLLALSYYPLKVAAAEWVNYVAVMSHSIKQYEYSTDAPAEKHGLSRIDSDLRSLEIWGRRCLQTSDKLQSTIEFIRQRTEGLSGLEEYSLIIRDFNHISAAVETYGHRLEIMVPVVTSVLQIADTRRSLREAANVTRLTNLALLFVPLSFVASLFSMNGGVSRHDLAIYAAVAIPMCVVVFLIARLPIVELDIFGSLFRKMKG